jgi:ceramide glucosyltransferase
LAVISALLTIWQWVSTWRFPIHRRVGDAVFAPPITILKPLKGADDHLADCLRSWLALKYGAQVQVIFGVASPDDPACAVVGQLISEFPSADLQLVICDESLGINAKVSSLIQMHRRSKHDFIVVSDADVVVPTDFLPNVVAPLSEPEVGLVNCFYRFANPGNFAMHWEAMAVNADFWSQVLQGRSLQPQDFALGAVMATRREDLEKIGGFESLADYLADDYQLGNRIAHVAGKSIALSPVVVDCASPPMTAREVWAHQLRWGRTIRACKPLPYAASVISNATLWPLLFALFEPGWRALATGASCLVLRIVSARSMQRRLGAVRGQGSYWWLPPVKDLLQFFVWAGAFTGQHVVWRGERFHLQSDGRLIPLEPIGVSTGSADATQEPA